MPQSQTNPRHQEEETEDTAYHLTPSLLFLSKMISKLETTLTTTIQLKDHTRQPLATTKMNQQPRSLRGGTACSQLN